MLLVVQSPIERVLAALGDAQVRYLVVGGVAVVLHGHLRTTADLDLVVHLDRDNLLRAIAALEGLGFHPRAPVLAHQLADPVVRETWKREKNLQVFSFWSDWAGPLEVDLFVDEPFDFDRVYERAPRVRLDTTTATVVPLDELVRMKERVGRPRDLEDVAALRAIAAREGPP
jgi:predicted nucleotidyltransferase